MTKRQTSLESWRKIQTELKGRQMQVYAALAEKPMSNRELSAYLNLPINSITPRVKELREMMPARVEEQGIKFDSETNRNVTVWGITPQQFAEAKQICKRFDETGVLDLNTKRK